MPQAWAQKHYTEINYPNLNEINLPEVERVELDNGMILFLVEDHELPIVNLSARIGVGGINQPADKIGLASITGSVMRTGGSQNMSADEIDITLESIGASVETNIGTTTGTASMSALKEDVDTVLPIFADVLMHPAFPDDKIELAQVQQKSGIARRNDNAQSVAFREFNKLIYGAESPFAAQTEYATIEAITRDDVVAFHQQYYHPNNTMLAIWGDFEAEEMINKIRATFSSWPKNEGFQRPDKPNVDYNFDYSVNFVPKNDVNQSVVLLGHLGGQRDNPDYFALQVMNNILGGGFSSRLFQNVRDEQGLAYSVFGQYGANYDYPGQFFAGVMTKSESTVQATKSVLREVEKMRESKVTEEELTQAKESFLNSFVFNFDTRSEIINRLMTYEYYGYPSDFLQKTKSGIEAVTADDVLQVSQQYLQPDQVRILVVGKAEDFDQPLSVLGDVNEIDIAIPPSPSAAVPEADEMSLTKGQEILAKAVEAAGGSETYSQIRSVRQAGKMTIPQMGGGAVDFTITIAMPGKLRLDVSTPMGEMVQVLNEENAFMKAGGQTRDAPPAQLQSQLWSDLLYLFSNASQVQAQYLGIEDVDGMPCHVLMINPPAGDPYRLLLDQDSHLAVKIVQQAGGVSSEAMYADFRDIAGLKVPFQTMTTQGGNPGPAFELNELEINVEVASGFFEKE